MTDIPRNAVTRAARLAALPVGYAGRAALGLGKRVGGQPAETVAAEMQSRTAAQLFATLGQLKGGAMKFGQALSIFEAAFPEDVAGPYREVLTKLQENAPAMDAATAHDVLRAELGRTWRSMFASFEDDAAAAASIGQVHRAVWSDGRPVAVKIQYPGAGKALLSDLNQVTRVARVATSWIPGIDIKPILEELKGRMVEELDYRLEAKAQEAFATAYEHDPHVRVPHVLAFGQRVLVSEWLDGMPLSSIIVDGTRRERDEAGRLYMEFLLSGPDRVGLLHADPHPGNFRLLADGRLGVVDFGAVKRLPHGLPSDMGRLLTLAIDGDAASTLAGLREIGFVREGIDVDAERLLEYIEPFIAPLRVDSFHFTRAWMRGIFADLKDPRKPNYTVGLRLNLPSEYFLIHRVWLGGIGVLCQLDSTVPGRATVNALIPGTNLPPIGSPGSARTRAPRRSARRPAAGCGRDGGLTGLVTTSRGRACSQSRAGDVGCTRGRSTPSGPPRRCRVQVSPAGSSGDGWRPHVAQTNGSSEVMVGPAAFAAAFWLFLNARTFSSDCWSTTSATDRKEPSSAYGPIASRQPAGRTPSCLPSNAAKMRAFCCPKPGSAAQAGEHLGRAVGGGPQPLGIAVVVLDDMARESLDASGHGPPVPVDRRWGRAQVRERPRGRRRDLRRVESAEPVEDRCWAREGTLHGELLVQQHPGQQGERVGAEHLVGRWVLGEREARLHDFRVCRAALERRRWRTCPVIRGTNPPIESVRLPQVRLARPADLQRDQPGGPAHARTLRLSQPAFDVFSQQLLAQKDAHVTTP